MFRALITKENRVRVTAPTGDKITIVYGWIYKDGEYVYAPKKKDPHYEQTQAARDSVDIKKILERYKNGDTDALNVVNGFYLDTVDIPKTMGELFDAYSNAQEVFNAMPIEIKQKYNNNPATFYKNYGTETFDNFLNDYRKNVLGSVDNDQIKTVKESEVNVNEQKSE